MTSKSDNVEINLFWFTWLELHQQPLSGYLYNLDATTYPTGFVYRFLMSSIRWYILLIIIGVTVSKGNAPMAGANDVFIYLNKACTVSTKPPMWSRWDRVLSQTPLQCSTVLIIANTEIVFCVPHRNTESGHVQGRTSAQMLYTCWYIYIYIRANLEQFDDLYIIS